MTFNTSASNGERIPATSTRYFDRLGTQLFFRARISLLSPGSVTSERVYTINGRAGAPPASGDHTWAKPITNFSSKLTSGIRPQTALSGGRYETMSIRCRALNGGI